MDIVEVEAVDVSRVKEPTENPNSKVSSIIKEQVYKRSSIIKEQVYKRSKPWLFQKGNPGGPGRPPGAENRTTVDLRAIRDSIVATWKTSKGNEKLLAMAESDFPAYAKLVLPLMPRATEIHADIPFIAINPRLHADVAVGFLAALEQIAETGKLSQIAVLEALDAHAGGTLEGPDEPDLIETGDVHTAKSSDESSNEAETVEVDVDETTELIETKCLSDNDLEQNE